MKMKRIGAITLSVILVFLMGLSGCGTQPNNSAAGTNAVDQTSTQPSEQSSVKSTVPVKLSIWTGYPELDTWISKMAAEYNTANPNVTIEVSSFPLRDFEKKVTTSLPSQSCADIISMDPNIAMRFAKQDMLVKAPDDLAKYVTGGAYDPAIAGVGQLEGIVYGIPHMYGTAALFCNAAMLKEAGLTGAPKTMEQLMEYAQKLTKYDASGKIIRSGLSLRLVGGGSGLAEKFWILMMENGGSIVQEVSPEKYKAGYDNEAGLKTLQMYVDMLYKYKTCDFDIKSDAEGFETEKTAMFARETWVIADIKTKAPQLDYFTAPMPGDANIGNAYDFFVTNTKDDNKTQAAWDFIRFMMTPENHKQMTSMSGWQSGRLDLDMKDFIAENPQYEAFFSTYKTINVIPMIDEFDEIETKLADRLASKGFTDPSFVDNTGKMKAFLSECAAETNSILKENGHLAE